jgi:hypothetical protein
MTVPRRAVDAALGARKGFRALGLSQPDEAHLLRRVAELPA